MSKNSYSFSTNSSLDKYTPKFLQHSQNVTNFSRKVNNPIQPAAEDKYPIQIIQHSQNSEDECLSDQMLDNGIEAFYTSASSEYDLEEDPMPTNMKMTQEVAQKLAKAEKEKLTERELEKTQRELEKTQRELEKTERELEKTQRELEKTERELEKTEGLNKFHSKAQQEETLNSELGILAQENMQSLMRHQGAPGTTIDNKQAQLFSDLHNVIEPHEEQLDQPKESVGCDNTLWTIVEAESNQELSWSSISSPSMRSDVTNLFDDLSDGMALAGDNH